jgi:hypothetical protein
MLNHEAHGEKKKRPLQKIPSSFLIALARDRVKEY